MEENQTPQAQPSVDDRKENRLPKLLAYLLGALFLAAVVGYGVYSWQQQEVARLNTQISSLKSEQKEVVRSDEPQDTSTPKNYDAEVVAAFEAYCSTFALPVGYERDTIIGTSTVGGKQQKFVYSGDGEFVKLNGRCGMKKVGEQSEVGGGGAAYILKYTDPGWLVIVVTQQRPSTDDIEKYAIPESYLETIGLGQ